MKHITTHIHVAPFRAMRNPFVATHNLTQRIHTSRQPALFNQESTQYEIYYPFPSIQREFSKVTRTQHNEFCHLTLSQVGFNSSASESNLPMSNVMQAN